MALLLSCAAMKWLVCPLALALAACASPQKTGSDVADAATAPLADLNLVRADIPPALAEALKAPYRAPADGCEALAAEEEWGPRVGRALAAALAACTTGLMALPWYVRYSRKALIRAASPATKPLRMPGTLLRLERLVKEIRFL